MLRGSHMQYFRLLAPAEGPAYYRCGKALTASAIHTVQKEYLQSLVVKLFLGKIPFAFRSPIFS